MSQSDAKALRQLIQTFVRRFGLLDQGRTPCGHPMPVSEAHTLMELLRTPGVEQTELAVRLSLSKSAVSRMVDRLERRSLVRRTKSADDGRAICLSLTEKGKGMAAGLNRDSLGLFDRILTALPDRKKKMLIESLTLLVGVIPEARRACTPGTDEEPPQTLRGSQA